MRRLVLAFLLLLWTVSGWCAHTRVVDYIVARVGSEVVTLSDVMGEREMIRWLGAENPPAIRIIVQDLVRRRLVVAQARKLRMRPKAQEVELNVMGLATAGGSPEEFWEKMAELGLGRSDVERRARDMLLARDYVKLKRRATYIPESEVRRFYREQFEVVGDKPLTVMRDELREHLAQRKYQAELSEWILQQVKEGRVRFSKLPEEEANEE